MKSITPFATLLVLCFPSFLLSQALTEHRAFFEEQRQEYQDWLQRSGFSKVCTVHSMELVDQGVSLNLQFATSVDSIWSYWKSGKEAFEADHLLQLEEALFFKMVRLFDLKAAQAFLQIQSGYGVAKDNYYIKIYTKEGELKVLENLPRGFFDRIELGLQSSYGGQGSKVIIGGQEALYSLVQQFMQEEYNGEKGCAGEAPYLDAVQAMDGKLMINVEGLCSEVLRQDKLMYCEILKRLKFDCSTVKRESLAFVFDYDTDSQRLYCVIEGKYSSDYFFYRGSPQDMDDDPGFERLLDTYGKQFLQELKRWIEQH